MEEERRRGREETNARLQKGNIKIVWSDGADKKDNLTLLLNVIDDTPPPSSTAGSNAASGPQATGTTGGQPGPPGGTTPGGATSGGATSGGASPGATLDGATPGAGAGGSSTTGPANEGPPIDIASFVNEWASRERWEGQKRDFKGVYARHIEKRGIDEGVEYVHRVTFEEEEEVDELREKWKRIEGILAYGGEAGARRVEGHKSLFEKKAFQKFLQHSVCFFFPRQNSAPELRPFPVLYLFFFAFPHLALFFRRIFFGNNT